MKGKISKQSVENLSCERKDHFLWDTELPMFGCKITPKGRRVYLLQYRIKGRQRRYTIGTHGVLAVSPLSVVPLEIGKNNCKSV